MPVAATTLRVGPGSPYERPEAALKAAKPGDTILVAPQAGGAPYTRVALHVRQPGIRIRAEGDARVVFDGRGFDYSGRGPVPRAIVQFGPEADGGLIEGFELRGAHNASHNGAGVRINQANNVVVRHCTIHGNDMGIMSNGNGQPGTATGQLIEGCLIHSNGDRTHPGYNHNLYLGGSEVTMRGCEVHSSLTGHNVKSRAHRNVIVACYIHDAANRELDLVDGKGDTNRPGSDAVLFGNVIVKDPKCSGNRAVLHFGQDGGKGHDGTVWLVHNTIVTPFISPLVHLSTPQAKAVFVNNAVWDGGSGQRNQVLVQGGKAGAVSGTHNWVAAGFGTKIEGLETLMTGARGETPPFIDVGKRDFRLKAAWETGGGWPASLRGVIGKPLEYRNSQQTAERKIAGQPSLGAFEAGK
jgi:type IV secretory pathway TrbD component